jgi:hypothetical protein
MRATTLFLIAILVAAITVPMPPAMANDGAVELATGGLVFIKNPNVVMREEDLFISMTEVRVRYVFFNSSAKDITNTVAFPMPDITFDNQSSPIVIPTDDPQNILGFSTLIVGRSVPVQVEQKVFAKGVDQTALLHRLGIPLAPHVESTTAALDELPRREWTHLINLGLADTEEYSTGPGAPSDTGNKFRLIPEGGPGPGGTGAPGASPPTGGGAYPNAVMKQHLSPRWTLKTNYYWQQTFPAQRELVIEHRYKPSIGNTVVTMLFEDLANYQKKYCTDADFVNTVIRARRAAHDTYAPFTERRIDYILTTGANWGGPIGSFVLVVDKGSPTNLVSFCANGVREISPTRFEVRITNFIPKDDLFILILEPRSN